MGEAPRQLMDPERRAITRPGLSGGRGRASSCLQRSPRGHGRAMPPRSVRGLRGRMGAHCGLMLPALLCCPGASAAQCMQPSTATHSGDAHKSCLLLQALHCPGHAFCRRGQQCGAQPCAAPVHTGSVARAARSSRQLSCMSLLCPAVPGHICCAAEAVGEGSRPGRTSRQRASTLPPPPPRSGGQRSPLRHGTARFHQEPVLPHPWISLTWQSCTAPGPHAASQAGTPCGAPPTPPCFLSPQPHNALCPHLSCCLFPQHWQSPSPTPIPLP